MTGQNDLGELARIFDNKSIPFRAPAEYMRIRAFLKHADEQWQIRSGAFRYIGRSRYTTKTTSLQSLVCRLGGFPFYALEQQDYCIHCRLYSIATSNGFPPHLSYWCWIDWSDCSVCLGMIRTEVYSKKKYRRFQTENQEKKREKVALGQSTEDVWTPTPTFSTRDKRLKALFTNLSIDSLKYDLLISSFSLCNYTIIFVFSSIVCLLQAMDEYFFSPTEE